MLKQWIRWMVLKVAELWVTPEEHAQMALKGEGLQGHLPPVYKALFDNTTTQTRALALTGHALAVRGQN